MSEIAKLQIITQDDPVISHAQQALYACRGGAKWIQFRMKEADHSGLLEEGLRVKEICQRFGALFIINDHPWLAKALGADGVHLGKDDMKPWEARTLLGNKFIIGGTANTLEDILALHESVNYVGLGPFRFTSTKKNLSPVLGSSGYLKILSDATSCVKAMPPVIAIGGILTSDIPALLDTGVYGVAVSSAVNLAADPVKATAEFMEALKQPTLHVK